MNVECVDRARDALRLAESDPRRSVELAGEVLAEARTRGDRVAASLAERAWGFAAFHLDDTEVAVTHLRAAVRLGRAAGSPQLAAEARITLAGVLTWRGRQGAALREIEAAKAGLAGVEHARAVAQQGAIMQLLGRFSDALEHYRVALPVLRRYDDQLWVHRVLLNRGVAHAQRHEVAAAADDLQEAERLCEQLGLDLALGHVHQNLGFVSTRRGDVPAAMAYLDRAETRFRALGSQLGPVLGDRAELLLSVRLIAEARQAADEAVLAFEREGRGVALPEARLLLAQAALLDGDVALAARQAGRARREFTRHRRTEWAALAALTVALCRLGDPRSEPGVALLARTADVLASSWPAAAMDGRIAAAGLAVARGDTARGHRLLELAARHRGRGVATLRARAWYAEALLRDGRGRPAGALRAARAGLRVLDEHVTGLGATDLRAHAAGHRTELAELGLRIALRGADPQRVFAWAELGRASHLTHRPVRPPADPVLAAALIELRAVSAEVEQQRGAGRVSARLEHRQAALERQLRDHHRRHATPSAPLSAPASDLSKSALAARAPDAGSAAPGVRPPSVTDLGAALGQAALLEFVQLDGALLVVSVVDGRARLTALGPLAEVANRVEAVPFALRQLTRHGVAAHSRTAAVGLLRRTGDELDALLLGAVPEVADRPLVVVPTGPLQSLPWPVLPSCRGRPVSIAPSAGLWHQATHRTPASTRSGVASVVTPDGPLDHRLVASSNGSTPHPRVAVAAGPDLAGAHAEAVAVADVYGVAALTGAAATVDAVAAALDGATLAHLATHGRVRWDNPLFSALRFADGPLMVYDLEALDRVPDTVVLAACDTGRPVVRAGDELMGLGATLLRQGAGQLVAPVLSVLDLQTAPLMVAMHRLLAAGRTVAEALAEAQQRTAAGDPAALAEVAPFVCLGAGHTPPAGARG